MKLIKKGTLIILVSLVLCMALCFFSACFLFDDDSSEKTREDYTYEEISTVEELYAMESTKCYRLTCNLNLQGGVWQPLQVVGFDGNGYTISNFNIITFVNDESSSSGFLHSAKWIDNLSLDSVNLTVTSSDNSVYVGVVASTVTEMTNVRVTNSNMTVSIIGGSNSYIGGMAGRCTTAENCILQNSEISVTSLTPKVENDIGGIAGMLGTAYNCGAYSNTFNVQCSSYGNVGGIAGYNYSSSKTEYEIDGCIVENWTFNGTFSSTTSVSRAGGLIGYAIVTITNSASLNNSITLSSTYGYVTGGFAGRSDDTISNCLSYGNTISASTSTTKSSISAVVGGFIGLPKATVSKCISQNNTCNGTASSSKDLYYTGGFYGNTEATVVYCAVYGNSCTGGTTSPIGIESSMNVNCMSDCTEEEWADIIQLLSLDEDLWTYSNGNPVLKIMEG